MRTEFIKELTGRSFEDYSSAELEILLDAIRCRMVELEKKGWEPLETYNVLQQFRTKIVEAKILVLQREKVLNG